MAFFQDTRPSRGPFINAPATVLWLIGVILAAHIARVMLPPFWAEQMLQAYAFVPARYLPSAFAGAGMDGAAWLGRIVPFTSYMFVHGDFGHVGINCLWLLAFGPIVGHRLGPVKFLALFFLCGIVAAIVHLVANWGDDLPVVGASGAVSGLMAAGVRILYGTRVLVFSDYRPLAPVMSRSVIYFSLTWVAINILFGVTNFGVSGDQAVVAWVAHLGGYFAGLFAVGLFDTPPLKVRSA